MLEEQVVTLSSVSGGELALLGTIAFLAAIVGGMSGIGGGIPMSIFAAPVTGVKALMPLAIARPVPPGFRPGPAE